MDQSDFDAMRTRWLEHVVGMVTIPRRLQNAGAEVHPPLSPPELALVFIHVGLSHLMGADRDEAALGEYCDPHVADQIASSWRVGRDLIHVAGEARALWETLWHLGQWMRVIRPALGEQVAQSFLAQRLASAPPGEDGVWPLWRDAVETSERPLGVTEELWDCEGSHIEALRGVDTLPRELLSTLTPLELRAMAGSRREARIEEALGVALREIEYPLVAPEGWGGPGPNAVPDWFQHWAVTSGGRILQDRAGLVPCWYFVAETEDYLRAFQRWRYSSGGIAIVTDADGPTGKVHLQLQLDFDDGKAPADLQFSYSTHDWADAVALDLLAWVGIVRLEVYTVATGTLEFAYSLGIAFPNIRKPLCNPELRLFPEPSTLLSRFMITSEDVVFGMRNAERVQFELVRRGEAARRDGLEEVTEAYEAFLRAVDDASRSEYVGVLPDHTGVDLAKRALVSALSFIRDEVDQIALDRLEPGQVFMQIQVVVSTPRSVRARVAHLEGDVRTAFDVTLAVADLTTGQLTPDAEGWAELTDIAAQSAVVSPSGPLYAIALHEDLLDAGFEQVSFVHRSTVLASRPPVPGVAADVLLAGYSGEQAAGDYLAAMDREFAVIEAAYGCAAEAWAWGVPLPKVVHLAGHGSAADAISGHWLHASPSVEDLITPARVLLEVDASATNLVFLSACSSGRGVFSPASVMEAVPLDVAFLERGATCVVSTTAPVNDVVAAVFAAGFHVSWRDGASVWEAYQEGRSAASERGCSAIVTGALDQHWPTWQTELARARTHRPDDWQLFRVSGRHW